MSKKPNILFITTDQHRADCLGVSGHPCISTPHLDRLAYEGVNFSRAYTDCPVCIPARTTMITGRNAHLNGIPAYGEGMVIERKPEDFMGSLISSAGYQTQVIGKTHWHVAPTSRAGFDNILPYAELAEKQRAWHGGPTVRRDGMGFNEMNPTISQFPPHLFMSDWMVDESISFLQHRRDKNSPFFMWLSFFHPHPPLCIHEPYYSMYDNAPIPEAVEADWTGTEECPIDFRKQALSYNPGPMKPWEVRKMRSTYYGLITNIDHQLGRLFGRLQRQKEWDNTWVIYTTDHGEFLGDYGNLAKMSFLDCSARLPFIVRPPKGYKFKKGSVCNSLVELSDLLPTFCEIASVSPPSDITGHSLLPLLENPEKEVRQSIHGHIDDSHTWIEGGYKYLYCVADGSELLFDLENDPEERKNLAPNEELTKPFRQHFIEHLRAENHPHFQNNVLLNRGEKQIDEKEWRARSAVTAGMGGAGG